MDYTNNLVKFANKLADESGKICRKYFNSYIEVNSKGDIPSNTVTNADIEVEKLIRSMINKFYPGHSIIGEELNNKNTNSEYKWIIDPIDGTSAFVCGKPTFCTLIALLKNNKPIIGIINQPILNERWVGIEGQKTLFNDKVCTTRLADKLRICATTPYMFNEYEFHIFTKVAEQIASVKNWGGDAYSYGLLAKGQIDIVMESDLKIYDIAAIVPVILGAGGIVVDWNLKPIDYTNFKGQILCLSSNTIIDKLKNIL